MPMPTIANSTESSSSCISRGKNTLRRTSMPSMGITKPCSPSRTGGSSKANFPKKEKLW